jgi:mannose-1-phosphate guanylyltransferase
MVERTIRRLSGLVPPRRTVTVVGPAQRAHAEKLEALHTLGLLLEQPLDRGTGVAVLWGLCNILAQDPTAVVALTPADHGIESEVEYRDGVRHAMRAVASGDQQIVLFGVTPNHPADDYGWIVPLPAGDPVGSPRPFRPVHAFAEKPSAAKASHLMALGALWNTMMLVGRADALIDLFRQAYPDAVDEALSLAGVANDADLRNAFHAWPVIDFSRNVLSRATNLVVYTWRPVLGWCDLGTVERLNQWRLGHARDKDASKDRMRFPIITDVTPSRGADERRVDDEHAKLVESGC